MKKQNRIEDSPEFQYFKDHFEEIMKEMEDDPDLKACKVSEEWDREFRKTIEDTLKKQRIKKMKRISKIAGLAAGIILAVCIGSEITIQSVQGKGIKEVFSQIFDIGRDKQFIYGTDEDIDIEILDDEDNNVRYFTGDTLEQVYTQIRAELKTPIFYFSGDVFGEYKIVEAKYDKVFKTLNIELELDQGVVYISQEMITDDTGTSVIFDSDICLKVKNRNFDTEIDIYENNSNDGYLFSVQNGHTIFSFTGNISLESCEDLAESLYYK